MNRKWSFAVGAAAIAVPSWIALSDQVITLDPPIYAQDKPIQLHPSNGGTNYVLAVNPNNGRTITIGSPRCEDGRPAKRDKNVSYGHLAPVKGKVRDHFFPLCLGGPDDRDNILIQTKEDAARKDKLEWYVCENVCAGKMPQAEAIELMRRWK